MKPMFRGWSHAAMVLPTVVAAIALIVQSASEWPRLIATIIYGVALCSLYTVSAVFHVWSWRGAWFRVWHTFDRVNIFLVIAATYTPIAVVLLPGWQRVALLVSIWSIAALGVISSYWLLDRARWLHSALYVGMGWIALLLFPSLAAVLPPVAMALLVIGGTLYTVGAVVYGRQSPNPWPKVFGYHEVFHLFVIAGGSTFTFVIWYWVMPLPMMS